MLEGMLTRRNVTLVVVWLTMCGAAFVTLFTAEEQDLAAFILALFGLQAPAFLALVDAPVGQRLEVGRAITIAFTGALAGSYTAFAITSALAPDAWNVGLTMLAFLALMTGLSLVLAFAPHPTGGRIAFTAMLVLSIVAAASCAIAGELAPNFYVAMSCAIPWPLPLLVLCWPPSSRVPTVRVVR